MNASESELTREAEQARYSLRSSFYYRKHNDWHELLQLLDSVESSNWDEKEAIGISISAWSRLEELEIAPEMVFCNPDVIIAEPKLIAYYRGIAILPQKGLQRLAVTTKSLEEGRGRLNPQRAALIARTINNVISLLIDSDSTWSLEHSRTAALLNLGSQVNGSWRNEIGTEGGLRVKELLIAFLAEQEVINTVVLENDQEVTGDLISDESGVRRIVLSNGYVLSFSSEPDVSIRYASGKLVSTIEVKYGLDPAGALERYGAAKKSFEEATHENSSVNNIYLASCITAEVRNRILGDRIVNQEFNLTEVLQNSEKRREFLNYVRHIIDL